MSAESPSVDVGRLGRLLTLIAVVTMVSFLASASFLPSAVQSIAFVAVGSVALVTAVVGFLIAMGSSYDASVQRQEERFSVDRDVENR